MGRIIGVYVSATSWTPSHNKPLRVLVNYVKPSKKKCGAKEVSGTAAVLVMVRIWEMCQKGDKRVSR